VTSSEDVLVCRLVDDKVTLVHRRLWPALVQLASKFRRIGWRRSERNIRARATMSAGDSIPEWVPDEVMESAKAIGEQDALTSLGALKSLVPGPVLEQQPRRRGALANSNSAQSIRDLPWRSLPSRVSR
jgi:hypothetical protein